MTSSTETRLMPLDSEPTLLSTGRLAEAAKFVCHQAHKPAPELGHAHHLTIQAWQQHFRPAGAPPIPIIWDPATVLMPPSCHYAVHLRLVQLMRRFEQLRTNPSMEGRTEDVVLAVAIGQKPHGRGGLAKIAEMSPQRWLTHGLKLSDLTTNRLWGEF